MAKHLETENARKDILYRLVCMYPSRETYSKAWSKIRARGLNVYASGSGSFPANGKSDWLMPHKLKDMRHAACLLKKYGATDVYIARKCTEIIYLPAGQEEIPEDEIKRGESVLG